MTARTEQKTRARGSQVPGQRTGSARVRTGATPATAGAPDPATTKRFLRRQRARRWLVWRRVLLVLAALAVVVGGVWLVFFSSFLAVQGAKVTGAEVLSAAEVEDAARVELGVPLATADLDAVRARVEALVAVRSAEVSRSWPDQVHIAVTEREAVAAVSFEGTWQGLDRDGVLFREYDSRPEGLVPVQRKASTDVEALAEVATVLDTLPGTLRDKVESARVESVDAITLELDDGVVVRWGSADESAEKAEVLMLLLEQGAEVYDVTAPGRPTISG
jgi:cell division protein FtsQ